MTDEWFDGRPALEPFSRAPARCILAGPDSWRRHPMPRNASLGLHAYDPVDLGRGGHHHLAAKAGLFRERGSVAQAGYRRGRGARQTRPRTPSIRLGGGNRPQRERSRSKFLSGRDGKSPNSGWGFFGVKNHGGFLLVFHDPGDFTPRKIGNGDPKTMAEGIFPGAAHSSRISPRPGMAGTIWLWNELRAGGGRRGSITLPACPGWPWRHTRSIPPP